MTIRERDEWAGLRGRTLVETGRLDTLAPILERPGLLYIGHEPDLVEKL